MAVLVEVIPIVVFKRGHPQDACVVGIVIPKDKGPDRGDGAKKDRPPVRAEVKLECFQHLENPSLLRARDSDNEGEGESIQNRGEDESEA